MVPAPGPGVWLVIVLAGGLLDIALQSRLNSVATLLAAVAMAGLVLAEPARRRVTVIAPVALALAAVGLSTIRSSIWVTLPSLAIAAIGLAAASQDRLLPKSEWLTVAGQYMADVVSGIGWLSGSLRQSSSRGASRTIWRGLFLAAAVVIPIAWLLASADAVFGQLLKQVGSESLWGHLALTAMVLPPIAALGLAAHRATVAVAPGRPRRRPLAMAEATVVLAAVIGLIGLWGLTQVVVALGGADRLLATANLTAADNARQGFFQLVAVATLLTAVIVGLDRFTARSGPRHHRRFLILTAVLGLETLGLVSATYSRLALYINGFGNTMLRTAVAWFLAWLAVAMIGLVVAINTSSSGARSAAGPLFLLAGLWIVAFGIYNPEASVARGNLERGQSAVTLDQRYLTVELGSDAVPVLVKGLGSLDPAQAGDLTERLCRIDRPRSEFGFLGWNRSVANAGVALDSLDCP